MRHYPAPNYISLAGNVEEHRREELERLGEQFGPLTPVLGTLAAAPMLCDGTTLGSGQDTYSRLLLSKSLH